MNLFVLIDARHEPQKNDMEFMENLGLNEIPFVIIFTKADKLKSNKLNENISLYKKAMQKTWETMPQYFISSAINTKGKDEILNFIDETNKLF